MFILDSLYKSICAQPFPPSSQPSVALTAALTMPMLIPTLIMMVTMTEGCDGVVEDDSDGDDGNAGLGVDGWAHVGPELERK